MFTKPGAAVLTSILVGLSPAAWALTTADSHSAVASADLARQSASPAPGPDTVSDVVAAVANADWNATFEAWKSRHPEVECQGPDDAPTELLCHVCRVKSADALTEWSFYALSGEDPSQCRLYQVRRVLASTSETEESPELQRVETGLLRRFGSPTRPAGCPTKEEGCGSYSELRLWEHPNLEIVAYRSFGPEPLGPQTVVMVRSTPLVAARRMNEDGVTSMETPGLGERIPELVVADLGDRGARFRHAVLGEYATDEILAELRALLDESRNVDGTNRYTLLLAADVLAARLSFDSTLVPAVLPKGLDFGTDSESESLSYRHNLMQEVLRDAPEASSAHDLAFLMMLDRGFDPSDTCEDGEDQFHRAVREATAFLSKRPDSRYRADVSYLLAQAYETWWSDGQRAREGSEEARRRAVELYQQIVRDEPTSDRARFAKFVLPRLMLRVPTEQQSFLCNTGC